MDAAGTALVTGASRGIGRATAVALARAGFDVVATMRDPADGASLPAEVGDGEGSLRVERLDVTDPGSVVVPEGLRVLVNNAGIERSYLPVEHTPLDEWREVFETNVFGLVDVTRRAIGALRAGGGGVICNVTSSSILVPQPLYAVYRASKAAVSALGESLRAEVAGFGIRVIEVLPGPIDTDMLAGSDRRPEAADHEGYRELALAVHEGRRGVAPMITSPADAASAIVTAVLDDDPQRFRYGCDPLADDLLAGWQSTPDEAWQARFVAP